MEPIKKGLLVTLEGDAMYKQGYRGNGCGSGIISSLLCGIAQIFLKTDISIVWELHDCEYNISRSLKNADHKYLADEYAFKNINNLLEISHIRRERSFRSLFAKVIYGMLVMGGDSAYWETSTKLWVKLVTVLFVVIELRRLF